MAKEMLTINGRSYKAKELDFNFMAELGMYGIGIEEVGKKMIPALRIYVAWCMGVDVDVAGAEISKHIENGGKFEDITDVFSDKAESSDFFQALANESNPKESSAKSQKAEKEVSE